MKRLLQLDSLPFLLTFLVSMATYQINQIIENTIEKPIVEYEYSMEAKATNDTLVERVITCSFRNVSQKYSFKNIGIAFMYDMHIKTKIQNARIITINPSSLKSVSSETPQKLMGYFEIEQFHPGFEYTFIFDTKGSVNAPIYPKLFIQSEDTIFVKEASALTFIAKNQILINFIVFVLLLIVIVIYLFEIKKT